MKMKISRLLSCLLIAVFSITYSSSATFASNPIYTVYTVRYLEEGTNEVLAEPKSEIGKVGDSMKEIAISISGYSLVSEASQTIILKQFDNEIIFYYRKTVTYNVYYDGNGNTEGIPPTDSIDYNSGDIATVLGNTGSMTKTVNGISCIFLGWSLEKLDNLTPSNYNLYSHLIIYPAKEITIEDDDVTLYAVWYYQSPTR